MKKYTFLFLVISLSIFVIYKTKMIQAHSGTINVKIIQATNKLKDLDSKYDTRYTKSIKIDKLYFPKKDRLMYYSYGNLGFNRDFLLFINTSIEVKKDIDIKFFIGSDDGFRLKIDDKTICQYTKDRPFSKTKCTLHLKKGKHHLFIKYFQGYGMLGLTGVYKIYNDRHYIGENSKYLDFYAKY